MASNFNSSKYKETFEKRFGSGAYESGLSKARDIGKSKADAGLAKAEYNHRKSEAKKAFDKQQREQEKIVKEKAKEKKKVDEEKAFYDLLEKSKKDKENKPLIPKKITGPIKDMFSDFTKSFKDDGKDKKNDLSKMDRFNRSLAQLTNGVALDIPKQIHKKLSKETDSKYIDDTYEKFYGKKKGTKVTDVANNMAGYLVPGVGISKGLKGTAVGAKGVSEALSQKLTKESAKKVVKETAKEGAAVGGIMAGTEIAARETLNPDDYNWKQNLGQFGLEVGAGAILDPALTLGAGKLISRFKKPSVNGKPVDNFDDISDGPTPFDVEEPNLPARTEVAATTSKPRHSIDTLMRSYKGQDVSNVPMEKIELPLKPKQINEPVDITTPKNDIVDDIPLKENNFTEGYDVTKMKDLSGFNAATSDVYRNFDKAFGKDSNITKRVLGELDESKARNINMQERLLNDLKEKVVKGLGITKGSKLSRYVQDYGEKKMNLATLMDKAPKDWEKVVKADEWFQQTYKATLNEMNLARAKAYPGDKSKIVPERKDYYRHYTELSGLSGLKNIFDSPSAISPHLAGTSEFTKPGSKYAGFMQKRGLGPYKSDAVGGFLNYVPSAAYATHIDPNIPNFRGLKNELADMTEDTKNMNGVIEYLHDYANDLAGKTNPHLDRWVQKVIPGGRTTMGAVSWLNNRVKTNTILGNLGSALAQVANIPNGLAFAKQHSVKGLGRSMKGIMDVNEPIYKSPFLKERYSSQMYRQFDQKMLDQPQKMAEWLIETADKVGTSFVWNSTYEKGLSQGVTNPIKYADENTRRLIAGRGVGEVPLLQKSKVVQTIIPFTLEVGNAWRVMFDMVKGKDAAGIAILFTANHVLNNITEELRGSPVTFDPIDAMLEAANDELSPLETAGRLGGEVLSNVPAGQFLAGAYPEYGDIAGFKGPTREEIFGERNPQRFGTGLVAANGISDPLFKVLPSFGGNQLKKSLGGLEIMKNGGSYKDGKGVTNAFPFMGETKELKFPVEMSNEDKVKMSLFGPYATDNAREYFDEERRPLSEKQTDEFKEAEARGLGQESYEYLMDKRVVDTEKSKLNKAKKSIKEIQEDATLTDKERKEAIAEVLKILELK